MSFKREYECRNAISMSTASGQSVLARYYVQVEIIAFVLKRCIPGRTSGLRLGPQPTRLQSFRRDNVEGTIAIAQPVLRRRKCPWAEKAHVRPAGIPLRSSNRGGRLEERPTHLALIRKHGSEVLALKRFCRADGIDQRSLAPRWCALSEDDLACSAAFVVARKQFS